MSYIVPRDKPKRCTRPKCRFMDRDTLDCRLQGKSWESFEEQYEHCPLVEVLTPSAQPEIVRCKDCRYNRDCNIQYHAQAGEEFYCGAAERRTDE